MGRKSRLVVFDFETGGLDATKNPAMELAMVSANKYDFAEELSYTTLIKPYKDLEGNDLEYHPKALEVHGIEISETKEKGVSTKQVVSDVIAFLKDKQVRVANHPTSRPILCGHNVMFDVGFLQQLFWVEGKELSDYVLSNNGEIIVWDTQQIAEQLWNDADDKDIKYSLTACFERAGLGTFMAHRALPDVRSTLELLKWIIGAMRSGEGVSGEDKPKSTEVKKKRINKPDKEKRVRFEF